MPFREPIDVRNTYPNAEQPTINVGKVGGNINVQGGGDILLNSNGILNGGTIETIYVHPPASGLSYYGLGIYLTCDAKSLVTNVPIKCEVFNYGDLGNLRPSTILYASIVNNVGGGLNLGELGHPTLTSAIVPVGTRYPIKIELSQQTVGTQHYSLIVYGLSNADVRPRDFYDWDTLTVGDTEVILDDAGANRYVNIAPSFESRDFMLTSGNIGGGNWRIQVMDEFGNLRTTQNRAHNSFTSGQNGAGTMPANVNSVITIPGNGYLHRLENLTSMAGTGSTIRFTHIGTRS